MDSNFPYAESLLIKFAYRRVFSCYASLNSQYMRICTPIFTCFCMHHVIILDLSWRFHSFHCFLWIRDLNGCGQILIGRACISTPDNRHTSHVMHILSLLAEY